MNALFGDITVAMTTFPPRLQTAMGVLRNLWPQCNHLRACFNGFDQPPAELLQFMEEIKGELSNIHTFEYLLAGENGQVPDLGCNNKMRWIDKCNGYYLTVDDDIYYPPDYVQQLVEGIDRHDGKAICTMHGKILHVDGMKDVLYLGTRIFRDTEITIPGMGVGGCVPKRIGLTWSVFDKGKNSGDDELITVWCSKHNVKRFCLKHDRHWLKELKPKGYALWSDDKSREDRLAFVRQAIGMKQLPLISIIIPCHECQDTISKLLDVLIKQTMKDWECICVDDSKEETGRNVIRRYERQDSRIRLLTNTNNPGAGANRNMGMKEAAGKYIWFVDCDDEFGFNENGLQVMLEEMEKKPADFHVFPTKMHIYGKYVNSWLDLQTTDFDFYRVGTVASNKICSTVPGIRRLWQVAKIVPWNKVYSRDFLFKNKDSLQYQNTHFANDNRFFIQVLRHFEKASFHIMEPVYIYNKSDHSISGLKNKSEHMEDVALLLEWITELNPDNVLDKWLLQNRLRATAGIVKSVETYVIEQKLNTIDGFRKDMAGILGEKLNSPKFSSFLKDCPLFQSIQTAYQKSILMNEEKLEKPPKIEKTTAFTFDDAVYNKHDAVFVLGDGSIYQDKELALAVHSMRKFCPFIDRIFIVGSKPRCRLKGMSCTYVPCSDLPGGNKDASIMYKVFHGIRAIPDLTDNFLLCSDDQLVTKPCEWNDFKPKYIKRFNKDDSAFLDMRKFDWGKRLYNTLSKVDKTGKTAYFYEPHIWSPVNKDTFKEMVGSMAGFMNAGVVFSQYYNSIDNLDHEMIHDHRFFYEELPDWTDIFQNPPRFIAYNDKAFGCEQFRQQLVLLLK